MNDAKTSHLYQATMREADRVVAQWHHDLWTSNLFLKDCDSPLEAAWRVWWHLATSSRYVGVPRVKYQHEVAVDGQNYRLDVALFVWGSEVPVLAIELDGHTFHERTPQQVADRNARDRALQTAGWTVLHFSYHEIRDRGLECAVEAIERFDTLTASLGRTA